MKAPLPPDEAERLASLRKYDILDTPPEAAFDDLTLLAAHICQTPIAMVSLVDEDRQWFKSKIGVTATGTARDIAFCAHTILRKDEVLEVRDAQADPRFADSTLVTTDPHIRFYAGAPLVAPDGHALGALCVLDRTPRQLTPEQTDALLALSRHVVSQLELRRQARELRNEIAERERAEAQLRKQNEELSRSEQEASRLLALAEKSRNAVLSVLEDEQQTGRALRESEARFRQIAEHIDEVFWITDPTKNQMIYISPAYETIWGRTCESLYQSPRTWLEAIHPDDRERVLRAATTKQADGTYDEEYRILRPDGALRWVRDHAFPVRDAAGNIPRIIGVAQDITGRKHAEEELRWKTALLEAQLDSAPDGILMVDLIGRKILQNQRMIEVWKIPPDIAAEQDDTPQLEYAVSQTRDPEAFLARVRHLYGHPDEVSQDEIELKNGTVLDRYSSPVRGKDGKYYGRIWTFRDITVKKQLEAQFLRSQRMESLGALAGGIAHDLNNALAPILMSIELLKMASTDPDPNKARMLDAIYDSAQRGAGMVKQILTFARGSEGERGLVQPKHLVQEMIDMTRHTFPKAIQIRTTVAPNIWTLLGNPTQLHQILLNLCVNARDAMPTGGTLTLTTGNVDLDATCTMLSPDAKPGPYVLLTVTDTGTGMSSEVRSRIFDAFFTTKAPDKGTGLGLSTVQSIVKDHGGFLTVDSAVGKGTTFKVYLPAQPDMTDAGAAVERLVLPMGQGELILVVDDEAAIRSIAKQTLEAFGYRVVIASDGAQAVGVCAKHLAELQLLLTDMSMPIMDGTATIRAVRTLLPRLPVIVSSGSDSVADLSVQQALDVQAFLHKPYGADGLIRTVHEVLREKVPS